MLIPLQLALPPFFLRPPPLRNQNPSPHLLPAKLHVRPLFQRDDVDVDVPGGGEEVAHAIDGEMGDDDGVGHFLVERRGGICVVCVCWGVRMGVMMLVLVVMSIMSMSVVTMPVSMLVHSMIPLTPLHWLPLLIHKHIPSLQKIIDDQCPAGPQSLLQLPRCVHHVLEVVEPEAHGREIEPPPLLALKLCRPRIGFVEEIAHSSVDGGGSQASASCPGFVG